MLATVRAGYKSCQAQAKKQLKFLILDLYGVQFLCEAVVPLHTDVSDWLFPIMMPASLGFYNEDQSFAGRHVDGKTPQNEQKYKLINT